MTFLAVEKFVRLAKGGHGHSHGHAPSANKEIEEKDPVEAVKEQKGEDGTLRKRGGSKCVVLKGGVLGCGGSVGHGGTISEFQFSIFAMHYEQKHSQVQAVLRLGH